MTQVSTIEDALTSIARNREEYDRAIRAIRQSHELSPGQRQARLRETWLAAMRVHYQFLEAYLDIRQDHFRHRSHRSRRPVVPALYAPARPVEIPESSSRYV